MAAELRPQWGQELVEEFRGLRGDVQDLNKSQAYQSGKLSVIGWVATVLLTFIVGLTGYSWSINYNDAKDTARNSERIASIETSVADTNKTIEELKTSVTTDLNTLRKAATENVDAITSIQDDVQDVRIAVQDLNKMFVTATDRIGAGQTTISDVLEELQKTQDATVTELATEIQKVGARLDNLSRQSDASTVVQVERPTQTTTEQRKGSLLVDNRTGRALRLRVNSRSWIFQPGISSLLVPYGVLRLGYPGATDEQRFAAADWAWIDGRYQISIVYE